MKQTKTVVSAAMADKVPIGTRGICEERVHFDHTLTAHHHELPPVYSTPDMIRLMETAGYHALRPFGGPGEISVGTAIDIEHVAPAGLNAAIKAEAVVESFDGRMYTLRVRASEGDREIGRGTIRRAFVNVDTFLSRHEIPKP